MGIAPLQNPLPNGKMGGAVACSVTSRTGPSSTVHFFLVHISSPLCQSMFNSNKSPALHTPQGTVCKVKGFSNN